MIYYANSHKEGTRRLVEKYNLRPAAFKEYISESSLGVYADIPDKDRFLTVLQEHPDIYAYVLPNLKVYFHPDTTLSIIANACQKYFSSFL